MQKRTLRSRLAMFFVAIIALPALLVAPPASAFTVGTFIVHKADSDRNFLPVTNNWSTKSVARNLARGEAETNKDGFYVQNGCVARVNGNLRYAGWHRAKAGLTYVVELQCV